MGQRHRQVYVQKERGIHDMAYLTLHFPSGVLATHRLSWLDPVKIRRLTVVGSQKMLVYDDIAEHKVILYDKGVNSPPYSDTPEEFQMSYRHGSAFGAVPVRHLEFFGRVRIRRRIDALVVQDHLVLGNVVVDQHLLAADHG